MSLPLVVTAVSSFLYVEPPSFTIQPLTPEAIKSQLLEERHQKQYLAAVKIVARVFRVNGCSDTYSGLTAKIAMEEGVNPRLLAGLIFVESSCNPQAVSPCGAVGLTQVEPKVWKISRHELFDPERNLRIGTHILAGYIRHHGVVEGLHHYNGLGNPTEEYAMRVLAAAGMKA